MILNNLFQIFLRAINILHACLSELKFSSVQFSEEICLPQCLSIIRRKKIESQGHQFAHVRIKLSQCRLTTKRPQIINACWVYLGNQSLYQRRFGRKIGEKEARNWIITPTLEGSTSRFPLSAKIKSSMVLLGTRELSPSWISSNILCLFYELEVKSKGDVTTLEGNLPQF